MFHRISRILFLLAVLNLFALFAGQQAVIVSIRITGPDERTLVIPPEYPEYKQVFTCTVDWRVDGEPDEEKEEEEANFAISYEWSVSNGEIIGPNDEETVTVKYRPRDVENTLVTCAVTIQSTNGFGAGTDGSQNKTVFIPVWNPGNPLQAQLNGSRIDGNATRVLAPGQLVDFNAILMQVGEEDTRTGVTITHPRESVIFGVGTGGMRSIERGSPAWTATGGIFPNGSLGTSVTYQAPEDDTGRFSIRSILDDYGVKPENELGSRDDAPLTLPEVTVIVPGLELDGNDAIVRLNRDDDNADGQEDRLAATALTSDDDVRQRFEMTCVPDNFDQGTFYLNATGGSRIRVWRSGTGGTFTGVPLPSTWSAFEFFGLPSRELHIEGIQTSSSARDILLRYAYLAPAANESQLVVKSKYVTVVDLWLGIDANYDGNVNLADEPIKATTGRYVLVNDDNDNGNNQADKEESTCDSREDDLVPISLVFTPADVSSVTLSAVSGGSCIKLWNSRTKGTEVTLPATFDNTNNPLPEKLYIEGIAEGDCVLRLSCDASPEIKDDIMLRVVQCNLAFDANRDGTISIGAYGQNQDGDPDKPFLFWVNDDYDVTTWDKKDKRFVQDDTNNTQRDCDDDRIGHGCQNMDECERDLEDFTVLCVQLSDNLLVDDNISVGVKVESVNAPFINLFEVKDKNTNSGLFGYIEKVTVAKEQAKARRIATVSDNLTIINKEKFNKIGNNYVFLVEGVSEGKRKLSFVLTYKGNKIGERIIDIELHTISWFYNYFKTNVLSGSAYDTIVSSQCSVVHSAQYQSNNSDMVLYVHGWNMDEWEKKRWAETVFKRLWWQGYKGNVALFSWPTLSGFKGDISSVSDLMNFDNSEFIAWSSATSLGSLINNLNTQYRLTILAHSMGNIVAGEAIWKNNTNIPRFISSQAAHSAQYYDSSIKDSSPATLKAITIKYLDITINGRIQTPDVFGHFYSGTTSTTPYFEGNVSKLTSFQNYYNEYDYALDKWEQNNILKPDFHWSNLFCYQGSTYSYNERYDKCYRNVNAGVGGCVYYTFGSSEDREKYTIFSYIMQSHSRALGTVSISNANNTDLNKVKDDEGNVLFDSTHYGHSRQFRSFSAETYPYWRLVLPHNQSQNQPQNIQLQMYP